MEPNEILGSLPHAFPFRMIDRVLEIESGKRAVTLKNVSIDEHYLQGHFPGEPVMPFVLIMEAMAQTGGLAFHPTDQKTGEEEPPFLAAVEQFRLSKQVVPGDQIILEATVEHVFSHLAKVRVLARVNGETVAEGMLVLAKGLGDKGSRV